MRLVIKNRTICMFSLCISTLFNTACTNTYDARQENISTETINRYTHVNNMEICSGEGVEHFSPVHLRILKENNLGAAKHDWGVSVFHCDVVNSENLTNTYIHAFTDSNSFYHSNQSLSAFILLNRTNNKYLLAKVEREDPLQFISDGKISYMGSLKDMEEARIILADYISHQKHY